VKKSKTIMMKKNSTSGANSIKPRIDLREKIQANESEEKRKRGGGARPGREDFSAYSEKDQGRGANIKEALRGESRRGIIGQDLVSERQDTPISSPLC